MLSYDYPLLGVFWTLMIWFLWLAWILLVFRVITDVFRSRDMGGAAKAFWTLFVIIIPWLGVLVYLIARGGSMAQRDQEVVATREAEFQAYLRQTVSSGGTADELAKLAALREQGHLTDQEFEQQKAKLLA